MPEVAPRKASITLRIAVAAMTAPKATQEHYGKLMARLGELLGGRPAQLVQRKTYQETNDLLEQRQIDVAFVCSGAYVVGHKKFGMELLAAPVVGGKQVHFSYLIVRADSGIKSLEQLRGKTFAFADPNSNTGYVLPTALLAGRGETPASYFGHTFYSYSHDNSIKAVVKGTADATAVDSLVWDHSAALDPSLASTLHILHKSPPYAIPPVVVHPAMPVGDKTLLRNLFLSLHTDAEARGHLEQLRIDRFDRVEDRQYDTVREMVEGIKGKR
jgi:phosphonate transport system substrate-binding protein